MTRTGERTSQAGDSGFGADRWGTADRLRHRANHRDGGGRRARSL